MSPEVAEQVVYGITLAGSVLWLFSLIFLMKSARQPKQDEFADQSASNRLTGSAEVPGEANSLCDLAAGQLAKGKFGPLKIEKNGSGSILFERIGSTADRSIARKFRRGELQFTSLDQNKTKVEWSVEPGNFRWMIWVGGIVQFLGLIALVVGCWAMISFVASSPEPAVRWQSLQMLQVVHFLWPPLLFGGLYRKGTRGVTAEFEALANNLPYLRENQE